MSQLNNHQYVREEKIEGERFADRKVYVQASAVVAFLFIAGLLVLHTFKSPNPDLSSHYFKELSVDERQRLSLYDWSDCRPVIVNYRTENSGMVLLRASNGEILFSSFAEGGVDTSIEFPVPQELNALIFEHAGDTLHLDIRKGEVTALAF